MFYILYVVIGLVIGTIVIYLKEEKLYKQLTKKDIDIRYPIAADGLFLMILWYYVVWPFPSFYLLWLLFWKYLYISLQHIVILISESGKYLKTRFLPELFSYLKKKKRK